MYFSHTIVTSWDTPNKKPQEVHEGGRSFINCVSEKTTGDDCGAKNDEVGECRMVSSCGTHATEGWLLHVRLQEGCGVVDLSGGSRSHFDNRRRVLIEIGLCYKYIISQPKLENLLRSSSLFE